MLFWQRESLVTHSVYSFEAVDFYPPGGVFCARSVRYLVGLKVILVRKVCAVYKSEILNDTNMMRTTFIANCLFMRTASKQFNDN